MEEIKKAFQGNCYTMPDSLILGKECDCHKRYFMIYIDFDKPVVAEFCKDWYNMRFMEIAHKQSLVSSVGGEREYFYTDIHLSERNNIIKYILWEFVFNKYGGWFPSYPTINKKVNEICRDIFRVYYYPQHQTSEYSYRNETWILTHRFLVKLCERPLFVETIESGDILTEIMNGNPCPKDFEDELINVFIHNIPKSIFQKLGYKLRDLFYRLGSFHYMDNDEKQITLLELANALLVAKCKK